MLGRIQPRIISCRDYYDDEEIKDFWLVFVEGDGKGYQIVYDQDMQMFGLSIADKRGGYSVIGFYGTFPETLEAMKPTR